MQKQMRNDPKSTMYNVPRIFRFEINALVAKREQSNNALDRKKAINIKGMSPFCDNT